ncbi:MAG: cyclic nucleotide-binding domain-containing protein [Syntrophobacteraceae bacterium]|nr:cyclic nucleotide-binding domain-containing protein [Syntrophobacteraceae bacterium]
MKKENRQDPAQAIEVVVFQAGEEIIPLGYESPHFLVILSGQVVLTQDGKRLRTLVEQDIFGLESLLLRKPSHYAAQAVKKSRIAKYSPEILDYLIRQSPRMVQSVLDSLLRQLTQTALNLLGPAEQSLMAVDGRVRFFSDGETVVGERERGNVFYRLVSTAGGLLVTSKGREILRITNPGEFFGIPILPANVRVRSIGQSAVEKYGADELGIIIRDYPDSAEKIMRAMIERCEAVS